MEGTKLIINPTKTSEEVIVMSWAQPQPIRNYVSRCKSRKERCVVHVTDDGCASAE